MLMYQLKGLLFLRFCKVNRINQIDQLFLYKSVIPRDYHSMSVHINILRTHHMY